MSKLAGHTRAALLGVLFAMVGFSYSLAYTDSDAGSSASSRAFGSGVPLRFTNPLIGSNIRDLGDVTAGSSYTRFLRATGGIAPYTFAGATIGTALDPTNAANNTLTGLSAVKLTSFALFGSFSFTVAASVTNNIGVGFQVTDAVGTNVQSVFRLTLVSGTTFRFANDQLPDGTRFRPYTGGFEFVNGNGAITVSVDAASKTALLNAGLEVSADGTITGTPLSAGDITVRATAVDARGTSALGRNSSAVGQSFTLRITENIVLSSSFVTTSIKIKQGKAGKDSISFGAAIAPIALSTLNGKALEVKIGATTITTAGLDAKGKVTSADKAVKASISGKGLIKLTASKQTLSGFTSGDIIVTLRIFDPSPTAAVVDVLKGTDVVTLDGKLTYKIGTSPSGAFLVTSVQGKDSKTADAIAFKIGFLALPSTRLATSSAFAGASSASVVVGNGVKRFEDVVSGSTKNGSVKLAAARGTKPDQEKVLKVAMSAKTGKGSAQTGALTAAKTGIAKGSAASNFKFGVALFTSTDGTGNAIFAGESGADLIGGKSGPGTPTK